MTSCYIQAFVFRILQIEEPLRCGAEREDDAASNVFFFFQILFICSVTNNNQTSKIIKKY